MIDKDAVIKIIELSKHNNLAQEVYVMEECSELQKEMAKYYRKKGDLTHCKEEFIDVVASFYVFAVMYNIDLKDIDDTINHKYHRAILRFNNNEL